MKILIVEDQPQLATFLKKNLSDCAYTAHCVPSCASALDALCQTSYDGIVLDIGLPDDDGFDLLTQWREAGLARVRSLLSRQRSIKKTDLAHRGLKLDLLGRTVHFNDKPLELTSREYALLEMFIQNAGRILPRNLICEKIWEAPCEVGANLLDVYMSRLRTKLEIVSAEPFFRTVRGVGYQLQ